MATLPSLHNVRPKPRLWELLPWIGRGTCTAIYPHVFVPQAIYRDIYSKTPDPYNISRVLHEQEHLKRAEKIGILIFYLKYFFSRRFRFEEELAACEPQFRFLKSAGLTYNFDKKAQALSGWLYFWCVPFKEARERLTALWNK